MQLEYKQTLLTQLENQQTRFATGTAAKQLIKDRSDAVDEVLQHLWQDYLQGEDTISLVAVGGYGRQELHPYSDIDLLILLQAKETEAQTEKISQFITTLWDIGLTIGQSVRTLDECVTEAARDVTVFTNLLESRGLSDRAGLLPVLQSRLDDEAGWSAQKFFQAKINEQAARHEKFNDTEYHLEPNIKQGPGGLRDLQTIVWVTKHQFGSIKLKSLVDNGFLSHQEFLSLIRCQEKLWDVRMALHFICGRAEERLLFDYQPQLADWFGYKGDQKNQKIEAFMRDYYVTIRELAALNDLLLQHFSETFLTPAEASVQALEKRFGQRNGYLTLLEPKQFEQHPKDFLRLFTVYVAHPELKGIGAETIREIRDNLHLIDERFRENPQHKKQFIAIFADAGLTHILRLMHRYGVLSKVMPIFQKITGLMQYDLFHTLTVDEHIIFVVRNLRRLSIEKYQTEHPFLSALLLELKQPEVLYLAGLFHDITKGQKGSHSETGAVFAKDFCLSHGMSQAQTQQVVFLVANHLLMSSVIQRQDVYDPDTIYQFSQKVKTKEVLIMLYLLTVADIKATNIELWNDWKGSLLYRLYTQTARLLEANFEKISQAEHRESTKARAKKALSAYPSEQVELFWQHLGESYFIGRSLKEVIWQTQAILDNSDANPLVTWSSNSDRGASRMLVYAPDRDSLFADIVGVLEHFPIHILEANIFTTDHTWAMDQFYLLSQDSAPILDTKLLSKIQEALQAMLINGTMIQSGEALLSRHEKHFMSETEVFFTTDKEATEMLVKTSIRPNLLTEITKVLSESRCKVQQAKIISVGEKAEDLFVLAGVLSESTQADIRLAIQERLRLAKGQ